MPTIPHTGTLKWRSHMSATDPTPGNNSPIITTNSITNAHGAVKWFDPKKGFGFIVGPEGQDIFAHYTRITGEGFRVLKDASRVAYDAERGDKGWFATRVVRIETETPNPTPTPKHTYARTPRR